MTTNRKMQSALRASLEKEDAALSRRLPAAAQPGQSSRKPQAATSSATTRRGRNTASAPATKGHSDVTPPAVSPIAGKFSGKPQKRIRKAFSLAAGDVERLESLRTTLAAGGHKCRRSALLRAGLALLERQDGAAIIALVDALPPIAKKGRRRRS